MTTISCLLVARAAQLRYSPFCRIIMAKPEVAQAFRNNRQLQQFVLTGVTPTGRVLGTGSYGSVEEVGLATSMCSCHG